MSDKANIPFSARVRSGSQQVEGVFPGSAEVGLFHLLADLVQRGFVRDWSDISRELARIGRVPPGNVYNDPERACEQMLSELRWQSAFDFCERLHGFLARDAGELDRDGDFVVSTPLSEVQAYISRELNRLFLEENFAYTFAEGEVRRRGRNHTNEQISNAGMVMGDARLASARRHFSKALGFFRDAKAPDYENAVKEAVCAVEAAGKALFPDLQASTLGELVKAMIQSQLLPKAIGQTMSGLYGFRSGGDGIGHGGSTGGAATVELAEFAIASSASQIILLLEIANKREEEIPF